MFFDPQPWPKYIAREGKEIDFASGVKLKSNTKKDQCFKNSGTDNEEITDSDLLLSQVTEYHGIDTKDLH